MNEKFTFWLFENFRLIDECFFYYKFDFKYIKTRFSYQDLLDKFNQSKTEIKS